MSMENKSILNCPVSNCKKNQDGICTSKKRCSKFYRCGEVVGIYKITLKDKVYIGMSNQGIDTRVSTEKSRLKVNRPVSVNKGMLEYFNKLCLNETDLDRPKVLEKYFKYEVIESSPRWLKVDENYNVIDYSSGEEQRQLILNVLNSTNPEVQYRNKLSEMLWRQREHNYIKQFKDQDARNGTDNCFNVKE